MDIAKAFSFVFEDERWVSKVLIGGLLIFIPFINFAALGYTIKVAQNVAQGNPQPLPEWGEFGEHFMRGLHWVAIAIVYTLPAILLIVLFSCITIAVSGASGEPSSEAGGAIATLTVCLVPLIVIVALVGGIASYSALARYIATNTFSEAFKFREVLAGLRKNLGDWVMLLLVVILAGIVANIGAIACFIGVLFTSFYAQCVVGHALGQIVARQNLAGGFQQQPPGYGPPPSYGPPSSY